MPGRFTRLPNLYFQQVECGDYLHPGFLKRIDRGSVRTIFEIGCADGTDTLRLMRAFPAAAIHAFECNPEILPDTRSAIANADRIQLVERAAWDSECRLQFFPVVSAMENGITRENRGASSCFKARGDYSEKYSQTEVTVEAMRIDTYCAERNIPSIDLLCIDVQGAELRVLRGLGQLIATVRYLISEIEVQPIYHGQALYPEIHGFLKSQGFYQAAEVYRDTWFSDYLYIRR